MIIRSEEIYKKANSIAKSCGTRDTLKIARELGIHLHFLDNLNDLLGLYTYRHKERHILLNSSMEYLIMDLLGLVFTHVRKYFIVIDRDFIYEIGVLYLSIAAQAMIASLKNRFQEE